MNQTKVSRPPPQQTMEYEVPEQKIIEESSEKIFETSILYSPPLTSQASRLSVLDCWGFFKRLHPRHTQIEQSDAHTSLLQHSRSKCF